MYISNEKLDKEGYGHMGPRGPSSVPWEHDSEWRPPESWRTAAVSGTRPPNFVQSSQLKTHMYTYIYIYIYICIYTHMYVYIFYLFIYIYRERDVYMCTFILTYIRTYGLLQNNRYGKLLHIAMDE
jgi:hypothetical protein